jgi:hypothetical protein
VRWGVWADELVEMTMSLLPSQRLQNRSCELG